jgi:hypothetical protein
LDVQNEATVRSGSHSYKKKKKEEVEELAAKLVNVWTRAKELNKIDSMLSCLELVSFMFVDATQRLVSPTASSSNTSSTQVTYSARINDNVKHELL